MKIKQILSLSVLALGATVTLAACQPQKEVGEEKTTETSAPAASTETKDESTSKDPVATDKKDDVSLDDVVKIYQETYPNTDITSIELDHSFGDLFYKVEGVDDNSEYELRIKASNKEVDKEREEKLDRDEQNGVKREQDKLDVTNLVPLAEITKIAEESAKGGKAEDWDLDKEVGVTYWKVTVKDGGKETEVKINAQTKEVLSVELDD